MWCTFREIEIFKSVTKLYFEQKVGKNYLFYLLFNLYGIFLKYILNLGKEMKLKFPIQDKK